MFVRLVSCVAVVDSEGRVLITQRHAGTVAPLKWEFPGGKVEPNETPEMAAVRELYEEVSLVTQQECLWPLSFITAQRQEGSIVVLLYVVRRWRGPLVHRLGQPVEWVMPEHLSRYDMIAENRPLAHALCDYLRGSCVTRSQVTS